MYKRHDKLSPHPPTISRIQRHCEMTLDTSLCIFPYPLPVAMSHQKSALWHNHYYAFIFHLLNAIVLEVTISDLFSFVFTSCLVCRIGSAKVPLRLALSIAVHPTKCRQSHLPRARHSRAQKQANKCPQKFNVYFLFV